MIKKTYLEFKNVGKIYGDGFTAVNGFNLKVNKGDFITLLGPSGCGKTTVLKMLGGFETVTEGEIYMNGRIINDVPANKRATSTVFQDYALFPNLTVAGNIKFGLKLFRVPIESKNPNDSLARIEKIKRISNIKANAKIKELQKDIKSLQAKMDKVINKYNKHKEWADIKNMRWEDYKKKVLHLESLKQAKVKNGNAVLDLKLKKNSTDYDRSFVNLKKWFLSKQVIDKEVDNLKTKINNKISWLSYWHNYPLEQVDKYEKNYTTRPLTRNEMKQRVKAIIEKIGLNGKENKFPQELSGGMQQRVALARSLVIEPDIILLDEPLSALDAKVRHQMQLELKRLHQELGITFILVTHDQEEALSLSTKVVVMNAGKIQQIGTPNDVYDKPVNKWTSSFIGKANFFFAKKNKSGYYFLKHKIKCDNPSVEKSKKDGLFLVRPEDFIITKPNGGFINAKIKDVIYKGLMYEIIAVWENKEIQIESIKEYKINDKIGLKWDNNDIHFIPYVKEQVYG